MVAATAKFPSTGWKVTDFSDAPKTRGIAVTYAPRDTCPPSCPLLDICYPNFGHARLQWDVCDGRRPGRRYDWRSYVDHVRASANNRIRLHVAGDLPGTRNVLDADRVIALAKAAAARRRTAWTYTHYPETPHNLAVIRKAEAAGLIVNLSANSAAHADALAVTGLPVAVLLPFDAPTKGNVTPAGTPIFVCPAQLDKTKRVNCNNCGGSGTPLCARKADRGFVLGFIAHGAPNLQAYTNKVSDIARTWKPAGTSMVMA